MNKKRKETGRYIFPKGAANFMKNLSQRTIYEAGMMAMIFIIFGLIFMVIYLPFFTGSPLLLKIGTVVNCLAGIVLLSSYLANSYQQYVSYLSLMGIIEEQE